MTSRGFLGASIVAAIVASFCCILPIVFAIAGLSIAGASAAFAPWRPYLLGLTFALLGRGFYYAYRPARRRCEAGIACARPEVSRSSRIGLWIATVLVLAFAAFPYYSGPLAEWTLSDRGSAPASLKPLPAAATQAKVQRVVLVVEGMDCTACASSIEKQLKAIPGVSKASVSYEKGRAEVEYDASAVRLAQIESAIKEQGFRTRRLS